ncbi:MAG TPA: hypothetical protein VEP90_22860 [Methylomirabilota bacterium]|nr:hypothetical protein [Methylomirabilota bacterium]
MPKVTEERRLKIIELRGAGWGWRRISHVRYHFNYYNWNYYNSAPSA